MGQVDALKLVNDVRTRLVDLATTENYLRDLDLSRICSALWSADGNDGGLVSELWVEGAFPSNNSDTTLQRLFEEGLFSETLCKHLDRTDRFPRTRKLFTHQEQAFRLIAEAPKDEKASLVVRAGTGSGKTEAFLLPILNELWSNAKRPETGGMSCLILYPMNALVADQVERVYNWLVGQSNITVFHFTSDTPENSSFANRMGEPKWNLCRKRTRQEARGLESHDGKKITDHRLPVPDIVITNYSMLEYMLCRPQDACFFGENLRFVVLDEAHLYSGTLAAEITLLLRRLYDRCQVNPNQVTQIATSATLGGDKADLRRFAATIFSTNIDSTTVVKGERVQLDLGQEIAPPLNSPLPDPLAKRVEFELTTLSASDDFITADDAIMDSLCEILDHVVDKRILNNERIKCGNIVAKFLHDVLPKSPIIRKLGELLYHKGIVSLGNLAYELWGDQNDSSTKATTLLLRLGAAARKESREMPLLPHRLHFLVRSPEGLSLCLNSNCVGPAKNSLAGLGCVQAPTDRCRFCNSATLPLHRCETCGQWALAGHENRETGFLEPGYFVEPSSRTYYLLAKESDRDLIVVVVDPVTGEYSAFGSEGAILFKAPCPEHEGKCYDPERCSRQKCPSCGEEWSSAVSENNDVNRSCRPLGGAERIAIPVLAETVLHGLPPIADATRDWKPGKARRLLCFSDSRREAARLGPLLTSQHEIQLIRSAIARVAGTIESSESADYWKGEVSRYEEQLHEPGRSEAVRINIKQQLEDARRKHTAARDGVPFSDFAKLFSEQPGVEQILDRDSGDAHKVETWSQRSWEDNYAKVRKHAEALVGRELDRPPRTRVSIESIGLLEIIYPGLNQLTAPSEVLGLMPGSCSDAFQKIWLPFIAALLDTLRTDSVIGWSSESEGRLWDGESLLYSKWATLDRSGWGAAAFLGDLTRPLRRRQLRLWFTHHVLQQSGCPKALLNDLSRSLLETVFRHLLEKARSTDLFWLGCKEDHQIGPRESRPAIQILLDKLSVRRPLSVYRCPDTGTLWTRTVLGWMPFKGCQGGLIEITSEAADADARWGRARRELRDSPIFRMGLWGDEHSAQLSPEENKRRQLLFKEGIRNILSSTTTMELGIDIGGLHGILMGNVPPGRANHMQRAGRAGRRSDGSAIVATYARARAFDREVFHRFDKFLSADLRRPLVFLQREGIARRHIHALLLAEFISPLLPGSVGAMDAYGRMGKLCGIQTPPRWSDEQSKPVYSVGGVVYYDELFLEFLDSLKSGGGVIHQRCVRIVANTPLNRISSPGAWNDFIENARHKFKEAIRDWLDDVKFLVDAWSDVQTEPPDSDLKAEKAKANAIRYQIRERCEIPVIEWLSDARFLPRYGFPINLQRLIVRVPKDENADKSIREERYRLERPSILALSEYVPGADVLVGGKVATSRGILKHWTDANRDRALGLENWALQCGNGHTYLAVSQNQICREPECGSPPTGSGQMLMFPRFGYSTAAWEPPQRGSRLDRVGEVQATPVIDLLAAVPLRLDKFAGIEDLQVSYMEEAELLLRNAGDFGVGFAVCTKCGFATSEEKAGQSGAVNLPGDFEGHYSIFRARKDRTCWRKDEPAPPILRNRIIAARETTDMLVMDWPNVVAGEEPSTLFSLGRALLLAGSKLLEIDARELSIVLRPLRNLTHGIILYDTTPGGSGHCMELTQLGRSWLEMAAQVLRGSTEHHQRCGRACLECLLDFTGQFYADQLDPKKALEVLELILS
ncbi:DEAD/DEAH box helicase [bacterium]|nr:DEAD/DEAH box helicase [bacterium]